MKENTVQKRQYIHKLQKETYSDLHDYYAPPANMHTILHKIISHKIFFSVLKKIKLSGNPNHIHTSPKFQRTNRKER